MSTRKKYDDAKSKVDSYKTVRDQKRKEAQERRQAAKENYDQRKQDAVNQINEFKKDAKNKVKEIKTQVKNQLEELLDIYKQILPSGGGSNGLSTLSVLFLEACENTKARMQEILVEEIISTIGCSEEQNFQADIPIYIKVSQIDLFKILKDGPDGEFAKFYYEKKETPNGTLPYSMNRELYKRLQSPQSFVQEYGSRYIGSSGAGLFNIRYVDQYTDANNVVQYGDFYEVTVSSQPNGNISITNFLFDYFESIQLFDIEDIATNLLNYFLGSLSFGLGTSKADLTELEKFFKIIMRIMGLCFDPTKKIDVAGTAKLPEFDIIDDDFFEVTNQELRQIEYNVDLTVNGLVEFEDCGNVQLPVNPQATVNILEEIITEVTIPNKIKKLFKGLNDTANDPNWQNLITPTVGINENFLLNLVKSLPMLLVKIILSPKVMLGFIVMLKSIVSNVELNYSNLEEFLKVFKKFIVNFARRIFAIFIEEIFSIIKREIKILVESLILDIIKEAKDKRTQMYSTIIYILQQLVQAFIDYRSCKSVIDEILKLLNLGLSQLNLGLPLFVLAAADLLGGVSDTRAFANVIENLQRSGLPTGDNGDGSPNRMNQAMFGMIKGQNKEQAQNGKTEVYIPNIIGTAGPYPILTKPTKGVGKSY
jgi:hypothetical protein